MFFLREILRIPTETFHDVHLNTVVSAIRACIPSGTVKIDIHAVTW